MSAVQWAKTVRCDWPGCLAEGEVTLNPQWPDRQLPAGWIDLSQALDVRAIFGAGGGMPMVREICSLQAGATLTQLVAAFSAKEATDADRT